MSRNGSGVYSLPAGNPVVTGTTISSTWANSTLTDIQNALTQSVSADGQTPITGTLNMASNKITSLATPVDTTDAVNKAYADSLITGSVAITGGTINGTIIGGTSPVAGTFTDVTGTTINTTNFHISESGGKLIFKYGTTVIASLSSSGVFTTLASNVAGGTP